MRILQETEKNARRQFKGLFDKKPGELSEVNEVDKKVEEKVINGSEVDQDETVEPSSPIFKRDKNVSLASDDSDESVPNLWTKWRRWFTIFPSRKCTII